MKPNLKCHCGRPITRRDVMQQGDYTNPRNGLSYVYIKFRCSHCKKLGEQFVKQEEWDKSLISSGEDD